MMIFLGGSGSGKSTLAKYIKKTMQYVQTLEQTTRSIRPGEENGKDYWYVSEPNYIQQLENDELVGSMIFNRYQNGECQNVYYGTRKAHIEQNVEKAILVTNADAAKAIKQYDKEHGNTYKIFVVYVKVEVEEQRRRLASRGDEPQEIEKRLASDKIALADIDTYADYTVDNSYASIGCVAEEIVRAYETYLSTLGE